MHYDLGKAVNLIDGTKQHSRRLKVFLFKFKISEFVGDRTNGGWTRTQMATSEIGHRSYTQLPNSSAPAMIMSTDPTAGGKTPVYRPYSMKEVRATT